MQRTSDGRFVEERVRVAKDEIGEILRCVKRHNELTWSQLAGSLGVSEHTIKHDYHKKGNTIPLSIYRKIIEMCPETKSRNSPPVNIIEPFWGQRLNRPRVVKKILTLEISTDFAEFYGMMLGDGCVYSNMNGLCITCDSELDAHYIKYVSSLIQKIFKVNPKIYNSSGSRSVRCVVYSREISRFMIRNEFPPGEKSLNFTAIPSSISGNAESAKSLIGRLTDTDGSVFLHPSAKIILEISIKKQKFAGCRQNAFRKSEFPGEVHQR